MSSALSYQQELFLAQFDVGVRPHIVEYGKRITQVSASADIIMFMARKSVCLAESLRILGLAVFQCPVTSDRVLDLDTAWLSGKRVALFDDALISGTTLYRARQRLLAIDCRVTVHVLCVNRQWWSRALLVPERPYKSLSDGETASLCANIVDAISLIPMPYATDYPFFTALRIDKRSLAHTRVSPFWHVTDASTNLQAKHDISALTYEPTIDALPSLWEAFGETLSHGQLLKLRLYSRPYIRNTRFAWCTLMPIVGSVPLSRSHVNQAFASITRNARGGASRISTFFDIEDRNDDAMLANRLRAKMRLLSYLAAFRLASIWRDSLDGNDARVLEPFALDTQSLRYLFPEPIHADILSLSHSFDSRHDALFTEGVASSRAQLTLPTSLPFHCRDDAWSIEERLTSIFTDLYRSHEIPARELALHEGAAIFDPKGNAKSQYEAMVSRLDRGFSLLDLRASLASLNWPIAKSSAVISAFLDRMIDRGVVVPTTCVSGDSVYRGYRHGEDVMFADSEKVILHRVLDAFVGSFPAGHRYIHGLEVEKLSVIAVRKMLNNYLRRPAKNILGQTGTIGVRFSLHGAVVAEGCPNLYKATGNSCIRNILLETGILTRSGKSDDEHARYMVADESSLPFTSVSVKEGALDEADTLGSLMGTLRSRARKKVDDRLTQNEITLLATATTTKDLCAALAAEVHFSAQGWRRWSASYSNAVASSSRARSFLPFVRNASENYLNVALNSAHFKYSAYRSCQCRAIVDRVTSGLVKSGMRRDANRWRQMWPESSFDCGVLDESSLGSTTKALVAWLYEARAHHCLLELAITLASSDKLEPTSFGRIADEYAENVSILRSVQGGARSAAANLPDWDAASAVNLDPTLLKERAVHGLDRLLLESEDLLTRVDVVASPYGEKEEVVDFQYALFITVKVDEPHASIILNEVSRMVCAVAREYIAKRGASENCIRMLPKSVHACDRCAIVLAYRRAETSALLEVVERAILQQPQWGPIDVVLVGPLQDDVRIFCNSKTTEYFGSSAMKLLSSLHERCRTIASERNSTSTHITIARHADASPKDVLSDDAVAACRRLFDSGHTTDELRIKELLEREMSMTTHKTAWSYSAEPSDYEADVAVIGVVSDEYRAIVDALASRPGYRPDVQSPSSVHPICFGSLPAKDGGWHKVAAIQCIAQGNTAVMPIYSEIVGACRPRLVVLLGMAGRVDKKLDLCDVAIGDVVTDYDMRAETPAGTEHTFNPLPPIEPWLRVLINKLQRQQGEKVFLQGHKESPRPQFRVELGGVGSGSAVVKDENAAIREWLLTVNRKTKVVETEAVGVAQQYEHDKLRHGNRTRGYLVVRGIADKADVGKHKRYRYIATANAVIALGALLSTASSGFETDLPRP